MENDELKFRINDLLKEWILFRDEALATLTKEDKRHPLRFEEFEDKLIKSLPYKNREYAKMYAKYKKEGQALLKKYKAGQISEDEFGKWIESMRVK